MMQACFAAKAGQAFGLWAATALRWPMRRSTRWTRQLARIELVAICLQNRLRTLQSRSSAPRASGVCDTPDAVDQFCGLESFLDEHGFDAGVQARAVLRVEVERRDHDHRNVPPGRLFLQSRDDLETVHLGHMRSSRITSGLLSCRRSSASFPFAACCTIELQPNVCHGSASHPTRCCLVARRRM